MIALRPSQPEEMAARHAAARGTRRPAAVSSLTTPTVPYNIGAVLDLGELMLWHFRGRPYRIPPLAWHQGQQLQQAWLEALSFGKTITLDSQPHYFKAVAKIPPILWRNCTPATMIRRVLHFLHLLPNPFRNASEQELVDAASFFLKRRMKSSAFVPSTKQPLQPAETV